jgi:catechol 2,3-dioxygenase-like lactoylglutathione lyase family enzyme
VPSRPIVRLPSIVIDGSDLQRSARFWRELLGVEPGKPRSNNEYLTVGAIGDGTWLVDGRG